MGTLYNTIRCKKYRICEECNKIRQANIANVTELASFSANARYSVVMPFNDGQDPQLINKLKTRITRKLRKSVFSEPIQSSDVRRITAYSTKIDSIPSKELYWGNMAIHALKTAISSENLKHYDNNHSTVEGV